MRDDARRLLQRLHEPDFAYHEFAGRFSDLELWPLFTHILDDPRLRNARARVATATRDKRGEPIGDARSILAQLNEMAEAGAL